MGKKLEYFSKQTNRLIKQVFPDKFKISSDDSSNGFKYINLAYGIEVDNVYDSIDDVRHNNSLELFDYGTDVEYYEVNLNKNIMDNTLWGDDYKIKVTTEDEFDNGWPTRMELVGNYVLASGEQYSGVLPIGLEYTRIDIEGSGIVLVNLGINTATSNDFGFQSFTLNLDSLGVISYPSVSGKNYLIKKQSYDIVGYDEVLSPKSYQELLKLFPANRVLRLPVSGIVTNGLMDYTIDHYTPDNGYYWDNLDNTYKAIGYNSEYYYDNNFEKIYYRTMLNNPYGSGVYKTIYAPLEFIPISGSLRLWDLDNLDISGNMHEVLSTGTPVFQYSGLYNKNTINEQQLATYIGYSTGVPHEFLPENSDHETVYTSHLLDTSWEYMTEGSELNEQFEWDEPISGLTNLIKINNPISRYVVTYDYKTGDYNNYITTMNSTKFIKYYDGNYVFTQTDNTNNLTELESQLSKNTEQAAITFNGLDIRPGSYIDRVDVTANVNEKSTESLTSSNTTISLERNIPGSKKLLIPNNIDHRTYMLNNVFTHQYSGLLTLTNDYSSVYDVNIDTFSGQRLIYTSGVLNYSISGYYDLETDGETHRFVKTGFKFNRPLVNLPEQEIIYSDDGSGVFWKMSINSYGNVIINNNTSRLTSYNTILPNTELSELILERNMQFNNGYDINEFNIYYRNGDDIFKKFKFNIYNIQQSGITDDKTLFFNNCSLDIKYVSIYDEQLEFLNAE